MPIVVNRVNHECPECKNPTIFNTGKNYFCGKCLNSFDKETMQKEPEVILVEAIGLHCEKTAEIPEKKELTIGDIFGINQQEQESTTISTV